MKVSELMKGNVHTCRSDDTLNFAAQLMWEHDCGCVPIVDHNRKVAGMLTDRDICMAAYTQGRALCDMQVSSAMSRKLISCQLEDSLSTVEDHMQKNKVRRLPVLDSAGQLAGLISLNDIAREAARTRAEKRKPISDAEVGVTLAAICQSLSACPPNRTDLLRLPA